MNQTRENSAVLRVWNGSYAEPTAVASVLNADTRLGRRARLQSWSSPRSTASAHPETATHHPSRGTAAPDSARQQSPAMFFADEDYQAYLGWLEQHAQESGCAIHAYVLMTNHVHLFITPRTSDGAGELMKRLGQRYVQYINRAYRRSDTLWEGRFRSCLTQEKDYVLGCYRYIELNPVRANRVEHAAEYPWSSYRANAQGEAATLLTPHPLYTALGSDDHTRQAEYRDLFRYQLDPGMVDEIRVATNGNYALGSSQFQAQVAAALGRRVTPGISGRPRNSKEPASPDLFGKR